MKLLDTLAVLLLIVGGLNWGLVGVADFDLVASLFGKRLCSDNNLELSSHSHDGKAGDLATGA